MDSLIALLIILLIFSCLMTVNGFQWSQLVATTSLEPPSREHAGMEWSPSALYIFGGKATTGALSDTWYYSFYSNTWTPLTSLSDKPSPRYGFLSGRIGEYWYITHGRSEEQVYSDTWAFHFTTREWYRVNTTGEDNAGIPVGRYFAAGGSNPTSSTVTLWMSMGTQKGGRKLSDTWILSINMSSPLEGVWRKVSEGVGLNQYNPSLPHARSEASGMPFGSGHFVLSGGCANGGQVGGPCPLEDTWLFQSFDNSWSRLSSCAPPTRFSSFVPLNLQSHNIGLLFGGTQKGPKKVSQAISGTVLKSDELYMFNVTSLQWTRIKLSNDVPSLRSGAQLTPGAAGVYMFGGKDEDGNLLNDIWLLERTGNNHTILPCSYSHFTFLHLHGLFMYLAWGILLPMGALIGRHYKWTATTVRPVWLLIHLICQITGVILTLIGFIVVFIVSSEPSFPHGVIGVILMLTIAQQFLSGIIRPWGHLKKKGKMRFDENEDSFKNKWLKCWKVYHQASGHIAIALGFVQVTLGVLLVNGPAVVWIIWCVLLSLWLLVFVVHEIVHCFVYKINKNEENDH